MIPIKTEALDYAIHILKKIRPKDYKQFNFKTMKAIPIEPLVMWLPYV